MCDGQSFVIVSGKQHFAKDRCLSGGTGDIVAFGAWLDDRGSRYFHAADVRATSPAATAARAPD